MNRPRLIGMIHLPALPGTPAWDGMVYADIIEAALADARVLQSAGFDGLLIQNSLDRPTRERVDILTVAQMASIVTQVRLASEMLIGVNIVKNDGPSAVAIAAATGADFVRVKVLTGAVLSAEGVVCGCAADTHALRARAGCVTEIWGDVYEPTSRSLLAGDFDAAVTDTLDFGLADAVIVTGPTAVETLALAHQVRKHRPATHVVIGGRITASSVSEALAVADTVIIGTALKRVPGIRGRVDADCAREIVEADRAGSLPRTSGGLGVGQGEVADALNS